MSDHGMTSPGNQAGIDPAYADIDTLADTVRLVLPPLRDQDRLGTTITDSGHAHFALDALDAENKRLTSALREIKQAAAFKHYWSIEKMVDEALAGKETTP